MSVPSLKLNTGAFMPAIGLGAWSGVTKEQRASGKAWFLTALKSGYKLIDTAWSYGTERSVGEAIRESGIPRNQIWITTKLAWNHPGLRTPEESSNDSLKKLGTDYVDLYLLHWPQVIDWPDEDEEYDGPQILRDSPAFNETWAGIEKLYASGKAKAIGVSNFSIKNLEKLLTTAKVIPAVNQVEMHPYLPQEDLKAYCDSKGIVLTAYTPTGYATVRNDPLIAELAKKYNSTPGQVVLAWHVARGVSAVPKSTDAQRQKDNITLPNLEQEDVKRITGLDRNERLCNKANEKGLVGGWTYEQLGW
ncbi:NADP-dependent oxidoreductase domain-containing protein [Amylocystis lapponica]|nr:NADP-dependent oxidoreductase domain-containing protein [Amylocystis lapponica]